MLGNSKSILAKASIFLILAIFASHLTAAQETKPKGEYASVNGLKMYYEIHGTGQPLVLLHGSFVWSTTYPTLAPGRQVIAIDMQGHGRTADIDRPFSFEQMADDTAALLKHLKIEQTDVFGYGMGGTIGLALAIRHPGLVRRLAICSAVYRPVEESYPQDVLDAFREMTPEKFTPKELVEPYNKMSPAPNWKRLVTKIIEMERDFKGFSKEQMKAIKAEVLIAAGDRYDVGLEHIVEMHNLIPNSQLAVFPNSDHLLLSTNPDKILIPVREFLNSQKSLSSSLPVNDQDLVWPQFRGPQSNPVGNHARLAERWSKTENVEWSQEIPGRGWSSPIVTGDKVFLTTVTTDGKSKSPQIGTEYSEEYVGELLKQGLSMREVIDRLTTRDIEMPNEVTVRYFLYCLNLKSGKVEWKNEFYTGRPPGGRHRKNSFVSESPVTDGSHVYVYVADLGLWAFDVNGKLAWTTPLERSPHQLDVGTGSSPVLIGQLVVVLNDNEKQQYIAAFDKHTGKKIWRTDRDLGGKGQEALERSGWATPFVWRHALRTEIVAVGPGQVISYDLAGKELWRMSGMSVTPIPTPFSYDGLLYVNGGRGVAMFAVRPGAVGDISLVGDQTSNEFVVWSQPHAGTYLPSALAYDGAIYTLTETGILNRFDAKTGTRTYKTRIDPAATAFTASPWAYNGKLFCLSEEGQTFVIETGEQFKLLHMNELDDMTLASPALAGERLLIRTERRLYSIRRKNSATTARHK